MATHIKQPSVIEAAGNKPKRIEEFIGRVNSKTAACSVARMNSPSGPMEASNWMFEALTRAPTVIRLPSRRAGTPAERPCFGFS